MTTTDLMPRVEKGAALLDERCPGWFKRIDIAQLALASCSRCVVGQLYGEFVNGLKSLDLYLGTHDNSPAVDHGFAIGDGDGRPREDADACFWSPLRDCWVSVIAARRFIAKHSVESGATPGAVDPVEQIAELKAVHARIEI